MYLELISQRLVLEPLLASHAQTLYTSLLDDRLYRYIPQDPPASEHTLLPDATSVWKQASRPMGLRSG